MGFCFVRSMRFCVSSSFSSFSIWGSQSSRLACAIVFFLSIITLPSCCHLPVASFACLCLCPSSHTAKVSCTYLFPPHPTFRSYCAPNDILCRVLSFLDACFYFRLRDFNLRIRHLLLCDAHLVKSPRTFCSCPCSHFFPLFCIWVLPKAFLNHLSIHVSIHLTKNHLPPTGRPHD